MWLIIGVGLMLWVAIDLAIGKTWIHREVVRRDEPWLFWGLMAVWTALALYCIVPYFYYGSW